MAAPVLLRVSVPRWERVARYAVCAAGILWGPGALGEVLRRPGLQMGSRIWSFGFHFFGKRWCIKPAKQCLWTYILYTTVITWHDSQRNCSSGPHDLLHRVSGGVFVPGLHSVLCAEGVLHHLRHHICAELPPPINYNGLVYLNEAWKRQLQPKED